MDRDGLLSEVASLEIQILPDAKTERIHAFENVLRATDHVVHSQSWAMRQVMEQTVRVAETAMTVLVLGETGTGKGLLAQTIHETSTRRKRPFIRVNCGALPAGLVESELFGHEKGAFTGAASRQLGRFELADGGTLFLDEIGDLPLESQRVLLHILEENALTRVGGKQPVKRGRAGHRGDQPRPAAGHPRRHVPRRLILPLERFHLRASATAAATRGYPGFGGAFCRAVCPAPAASGADARRRGGRALAGVFLAGECAGAGAPDSIGQSYCARHGVIRVGDLLLPSVGRRAGEAVPPALVASEGLDEKQQLVEALQATNWMIYGERGAARLLGMGPEKLRYRMKKYGLRRPKTS